MPSTLTVLGSCGAWPEPGRACSGLLLEHRGYRVVLDPGYGTAARLFELLDAADGKGSGRRARHAPAPRPRGRPPCPAPGAVVGARGEAAIPVYAAEGVREVIVALEDGRSAEVDAVFAWHPLPGSYDVGPFRLASYDLPHWVPDAGVRLECDEFTVAYSGDSGPSDRLVDLAAGTDLFVCGASDRHQQAQVPPANERGLHLDARGAAEAAAAAGARRLLLTHFWPGNDRERTRGEAAAVFDGPVELADEGLVLSLP